MGIVGPYYYSDRSEAELLEHVRFLDDALKMPLFFYNNPAYQGYPVTPARLRRMREVAPRLFGAKLAMGSIDDAMGYRDAMGPDFGLFVLASSLYPGLRCGITGTVSPPLTLAPDIGVALVRAVEQGKDIEAGRLQEAVIRFHAVFIRLGQSCGRASYAEGLRHVGFPLKQYPRWPTPAIPEGAKAEIRRAIDEANAAVK